MSFYRDTYLRSDEWKSLRSIKIGMTGSRCQLCQNETDKPDVHHVKYKRLFDVTENELRVLCRGCHDWVHSLLIKYPKMRTLRQKKLWGMICYHFKVKPKNDKNAKSKGGFSQETQIFGALKSALKQKGMIARGRMRFSENIGYLLMGDRGITSTEFLDAYLRVTHQDPRSYMLDVIRKFPNT